LRPPNGRRHPLGDEGDANGNEHRKLSPRQLEATHQILDLLAQYVDKGGTHAEFVVLLEDNSYWLRGLFGIEP
jgi:hypothetical protein